MITYTDLSDVCEKCNGFDAKCPLCLGSGARGPRWRRMDPPVLSAQLRALANVLMESCEYVHNGTKTVAVITTDVNAVDVIGALLAASETLENTYASECPLHQGPKDGCGEWKNLGLSCADPRTERAMAYVAQAVNQRIAENGIGWFLGELSRGVAQSKCKIPDERDDE